MIHGLVRSPSSFFDVTPTGALVNNFSNDMGILDATLPLIIVDVIEGPMNIMVLFVNIATVDLYFIATGIITLIIMIGIIMFFKDTMIAVKKLILKLKNPVFSKVHENLLGLVQLHVFKKRAHALK